MGKFGTKVVSSFGSKKWVQIQHIFHICITKHLKEPLCADASGSRIITPKFLHRAPLSPKDIHNLGPLNSLAPTILASTNHFVFLNSCQEFPLPWYCQFFLGCVSPIFPRRDFFFAKRCHSESCSECSENNGCVFCGGVCGSCCIVAFPKLCYRCSPEGASQPQGFRKPVCSREMLLRGAGGIE